MEFMLASVNSPGIVEALQISLLGMAIVFFVLILLFAMIRLLRIATDRFEKPSEKEKPSKPSEEPKAQVINSISAGEVKLNTIDDKTASMLMAIVADEAGIPLNELMVNSIREAKASPGVGTAIEINKKYVFKIGRESSES